MLIVKKNMYILGFSCGLSVSTQLFLYTNNIFYLLRYFFYCSALTFALVLCLKATAPPVPRPSSGATTVSASAKLSSATDTTTAQTRTTKSIAVSRMLIIYL